MSAVDSHCQSGNGCDGEPHRKRLKLVVVDDDQDTAKSLTFLLRFAGHDVRAAFSGPDALDAVRTELPDAVLLDLGMPGMDGYDVARKMREQIRGQDLALIAVSGYAQDRYQERTREAGFLHYFLKPVELGPLLEVLADLDHAVAEGQRSVSSDSPRA